MKNAVRHYETHSVSCKSSVDCFVCNYNVIGECLYRKEDSKHRCQYVGKWFFNRGECYNKSAINEAFKEKATEVKVLRQMEKI